MAVDPEVVREADGATPPSGAPAARRRERGRPAGGARVAGVGGWPPAPAA